MLTITLALLHLGFGTLLVISPGQPLPLRDQAGEILPGSISERVTIEVGGIAQAVFIQSRDPFNPLLLFLHGRAGMPYFFMTANYPTYLTDHFTVVWWKQR